MLVDLYQEYLFVIGKLKDVYSLDVEVDHKNIHTFFRDKRPLFKLMFGQFEKDKHESIVASFHINLIHAEAIQWFINIYNYYPPIKLHDSWILDSAGEAYLGEDALILQKLYLSQEVLDTWLNNNSIEEMKAFVKTKIVGRTRVPNKSFDSQSEKEKATIEFDRIAKPDDDENVH